jgi:hypothetical protein
MITQNKSGNIKGVANKKEIFGHRRSLHRHLSIQHGAILRSNACSSKVAGRFQIVHFVYWV